MILMFRCYNWCEDGGYKTNKLCDGYWKEYKFQIIDNDTNRVLIDGLINCHAAQSHKLRGYNSDKV